MILLAFCIYFWSTLNLICTIPSHSLKKKKSLQISTMQIDIDNIKYISKINVAAEKQVQ